MTWGFSPLDRELGLLPGMQLLPLFHEALVRLSGWMPFARAAELLGATLKVTVSKATAERQTLVAGRALVEAETKATEWLIADLPEPTAAGVAHQQISVDGAFVPLIKEWAEVKTMAIGTLLPGKDGLPKAKDLSYFSRMTDHQTFGRLATLETYRRATDKAAKVTAVVDGADWIQEFLDLQCQRAVRVIDWGHSSAYITRASQACFTDVGQAADWRGSQLNELLHGDPQEVLIELCQKLTACTVGSDQEAVVSTSLGYLARRLDQVQYRDFRAAGLPIGSGIVESANKVVVEARLKGAGMRWKRPNVDPMLALRNAICSGTRWSDSWHQLERYRLRTAAEHAHTAHLDRQPAFPPPPAKPARRRPSFRNFSLRPVNRRANR